MTTLVTYGQLVLYAGSAVLQATYAFDYRRRRWKMVGAAASAVLFVWLAGRQAWQLWG